MTSGEDMSKTIEQFFKPACGEGSSSLKEVPAVAVLAAQKEVAKEMEKIAKAEQKRGAYATISEELKAKVAKYAAENGISASLRHFKSSQELDLNENTVRGWVTALVSRSQTAFSPPFFLGDVIGREERFLPAFSPDRRRHQEKMEGRKRSGYARLSPHTRRN